VKTLNETELKRYFSSPGTVSQWWEPELGRYKFFYEKELKIMEENLAVHSSSTVLDAATGKGRFARWYAKKNCSVTAVDINREMLEIAKERAKQDKVIDRVEFIQSDVDTLPFQNKTFDIVSVMQFLDHVTDPSKSIQMLSNYLKENGYLVVTFVSEKSLYGKLRKIYLRLSDFFNPNFVNLSKTYTLSEIDSALRSSGMTLKSAFGIGLLSAPQERVNLPYFIRNLLEFLSRTELLIKPYYRMKSLIPYTSTVVVIAQKNPQNRHAEPVGRSISSGDSSRSATHAEPAPAKAGALGMTV